MTPDRAAPSRVAEDYLKAVWSAEEWDGDPITTKRLAERFGTTAATASATVKRLTSRGLLTHEAYGAIGLTAEGRRRALAVVRRHRLLETFLVEVLHYDWTEVHEEAEELEHAASDRLVERIAAALGDPAADPHGDPIPGPDGALRRPRAVQRLATAAPGVYRVVRIADSDAAVLERLGDAGVRPGGALEVLGATGDAVAVATAARVEVPAADAEAVLLEEVPAAAEDGPAA